MHVLSPHFSVGARVCGECIVTSSAGRYAVNDPRYAHAGVVSTTSRNGAQIYGTDKMGAQCWSCLYWE